MSRISPTTVRINLKALRANFRALRRRVPARMKILATVKSNAYGHGAVPVAQALQAAGADFFGVGTIDEGIQLRRAGIRRPILILLGLIDGGFTSLIRYDLTPVIYDLKTASRLNRFLVGRHRTLDVHVKVDTGMTRLGFFAADAGSFFTGLGKLASIRPVGLLSHLADADNPRFTERQLNAFRKASRLFVKRFDGASWLHIDNSLAAIDNIGAMGAGGGEAGVRGVTAGGPLGGFGGDSPDRTRRLYEIVRLGIALYGAYPVARQRRRVNLKPVLSWTTKLASIKTVPAGTFVSYGRRFRTSRRSRIGVLPVGYADGYFRNLSNKGQVLVRGKKVPVVGTICMDMMMVDLTSVPLARIGDEAVLIGRQGGREVRAEELAEKAGTISYEIFCRISERNPRITVD